MCEKPTASSREHFFGSCFPAWRQEVITRQLCFRFLQVLLGGRKKQAIETPVARFQQTPRRQYLNKLGIHEDALGKTVSHTKDLAALPRLTSARSLKVQTAQEVQVPVSNANKDVRQTYLRKLAYHKVWLPMAQRPLKYQAVIIFDWDDTLICTSFLSKRADLPRTAAFDRQMKKVEESAVKILRQATQAGRVLIITNAVDGWVEYSAKEYMPEILPVLRRVEVVSARHRYGSQFPDEAAQWKVHTFLDAQKRLPQILTNLIAVGDSDFEMDAARIMGHRFAEGLTKTVKLRENPAPEELVKDLEFLSRNFTSVIDSVKNLQLNVLRKSAWKY